MVCLRGTMYPFFRLNQATRKAKKMPALLHPFEITSLNMRVMPWDIDPFLELNNGRYLTLMDLGRFAHGKRFDLLATLKQNKWGLMVAAVSSRYRFRLKLWETFTLHTKMLYYDDRWFYFHQWFTSEQKNGTKIHASFLVRTAVISNSGLVPTQDVEPKINFDNSLLQTHNKTSEWIESWVNSDDLHKQVMEVDLTV